MCKNADTPCPGCEKHKKVNTAWLFFTNEERQAIEASTKLPALVDVQPGALTEPDVPPLKRSVQYGRRP